MVTINDQQFIAIDWGTTHYRMYLVNTGQNTVLTSLSTDEGIKYMHQQCAASPPQSDVFYLDFLAKKLNSISKFLLGGEFILISGMASSSIGIRSLPYAVLPFDCSGSNLVIEEISAPGFTNRIFLISGVRAEEDVMRGEETQLLGLADSIESDEYLIVLPGTHSKHVLIKHGQIIHFKTYMTGELFDILGKHSILKESILNETLSSPEDFSFSKGVANSSGNGFLNELFRIRARDLFRLASRTENYYYLSGLLIGQELNNLKKVGLPIYIAATGHLAKLYYLAGQQLALTTHLVEEHIVQYAAIAGQIKILKERILKQNEKHL